MALVFIAVVLGPGAVKGKHRMCQERRQQQAMPPASRRSVISQCAAAALGLLGLARSAAAADPHPDVKWYREAVAMLQLARSWGDQPYGAVLVLDGAIAGHGPSRVIRNGNPDAHAEREAIRDAQQRLGRDRLDGSLLYSTSRPCRVCEAAAAAAGVSRMYFGAGLVDAGRPRAAD